MHCVSLSPSWDCKEQISLEHVQEVDVNNKRHARIRIWLLPVNGISPPWSPLYFWVLFFFILLQQHSFRSVHCWAGPNTKPLYLFNTKLHSSQLPSRKGQGISLHTLSICFCMLSALSMRELSILIVAALNSQSSNSSNFAISESTFEAYSVAFSTLRNFFLISGHVILCKKELLKIGMQWWGVREGRILLFYSLSVSLCPCTMNFIRASQPTSQPPVGGTRWLELARVGCFPLPR